KIRRCLLDRISLTGYVQFGAESDVAVVFAVDHRGESSRIAHPFPFCVERLPPDLDQQRGAGWPLPICQDANSGMVSKSSRTTERFWGSARRLFKHVRSRQVHPGDRRAFRLGKQALPVAPARRRPHVVFPSVAPMGASAFNFPSPPPPRCPPAPAQSTSRTDRPRPVMAPAAR